MIDILYEYAESFKEGLAAVRKNEKFGFINKQNEVIIPFKYDNVYSFIYGEAKVVIGKESFYIDKKGNRI